MGYPTERKEAVLKKRLPPHNQSIPELAKEEGISEGTLYNGRKAARAEGRRMEGTGMRWVMPGAQAMLGLRCIYINGDWDYFMKFHIKQEQKALYSVRAANDSAFYQPMVA